MKKTVKPLGKQLLLEQIKKTQTEGGIFLPENAQQDCGLKVKAVGDEVKKKVKAGDFVVVDARGMSAIKADGVPENFFLCHEDAILAIIKTV